jgi:hypothetical protein
MDALSTDVPNDHATIVGSLLTSGIQAPFDKYSVTVNGGSSIQPDREGNFATYLPKGSRATVEVRDDSGAIVLAAEATVPPRPGAVLRIDPDPASTAAYLVARKQPELEATARTQPHTVKPAADAVRQCLRQRGVSPLSAPEVMAAVETVLPLVQAASNEAPSPDPSEMPFTVEVETDGPSGSSQRVSAAFPNPQPVVAAATAPAVPPGSPSPSPDNPVTQTQDFEAYPYPYTTPTGGEGVVGHTYLQPPDPALPLGDGISIQRQTWDNMWIDTGLATTPNLGAWYASDWDLRKYVTIGGIALPSVPGTCATTTVRLDVIAPSASGANTSQLGTHNSVEVTVTNCSVPGTGDGSDFVQVARIATVMGSTVR